jgi:hypothetical protein
MPTFTLQFPIQQVPEYAARYTDDDDEVLAIARAVRARGHYTLEEFRRVCRWKTPRSAPLVALNSADSVEASTRMALAHAGSDRERVKELRSLRGVGLPTASVLLHLVYPERYPILDVRALQALGVPPQYGYGFWESYASESAPDRAGRRRWAHSRPGPLAVVERAERAALLEKDDHGSAPAVHRSHVCARARGKGAHRCATRRRKRACCFRDIPEGRRVL